MKIFNKITFAFAFLFTLLSVNTLFAQKGPYIGIKGSALNSWLLNSDDQDNSSLDYKFTVRPSFGLEAGFNLSDHIGIGAEALYAMTGQKYETASSEFTQKLDYIKVPVLLSYNTNPDAFIMFRVKAGPQFAFLTNAKIVDADGENLVDDNKKQFTTTNIGGMAALGLDFRLTEHLLLTSGLRFDFGFNNTENKDYEFYNSNRAITHAATGGIELGLRYVIR